MVNKEEIIKRNRDSKEKLKDIMRKTRTPVEDHTRVKKDFKQKSKKKFTKEEIKKNKENNFVIGDRVDEDNPKPQTKPKFQLKPKSKTAMRSKKHFIALQRSKSQSGQLTTNEETFSSESSSHSLFKPRPPKKEVDADKVKTLSNSQPDPPSSNKQYRPKTSRNFSRRRSSSSSS
jgi:hypothetical protein